MAEIKIENCFIGAIQADEVDVIIVAWEAACLAAWNSAYLAALEAARLAVLEAAESTQHRRQIAARSVSVTIS